MKEPTGLASWPSSGFDASPRQGVVYTRREIVDLCLNIAHSAFDGSFVGKRVLDIGCGYGQFSIPIAVSLCADYLELESGADVHAVLRSSLRGVEIRDATASETRRRLSEVLEVISGRLPTPSDLELVIQRGDFLRWKPDLGPFDLIVGNLPYVRHDQISGLEDTLGVGELRRQFGTFRGRADYSVPILERAVELLSPSGVAVLITSNRFARSDYGRSIRALIADSTWTVDEIDLTRVRAFDSAVSARASVFVLTPRPSKKEPESPVYVHLLNGSQDSLTELGRTFPDRLADGRGYRVVRRAPPARDGSPWSVIPRAIEETLQRLCNDYDALGSLDLEVCKGPATGADAVFTGPAEQFNLPEDAGDGLLLPLFDWGAGSRSEDQSSRYLLSVYEPGTRDLIAFEDLPDGVQDYLRSHRSRLEKRHVVAIRGREWWRTIDSFDPLLLGKPKALVPDLRPASRTTLDEGLYFPAHTVIAVSVPDVEVLRGVHTVLASPVVDEFRFWCSPDMGPRSPRASARVIRRLPVPPVETLKEIGRSGGSEAVFDAYELADPLKEMISERQTRREQRGKGL